MKSFCLLLALFCAATRTLAQNESVPAICPLTIGDCMPDLVFSNIINYPSRTIRLSDLKGKLVILDMWSTYCSSCIAGFPKMQKLQDKFKDKIQILLVNPYNSRYDSSEKINATLQRLKALTGFYPAIPIPVHDTVLNALFPHTSIPEVILINNSGVLIGITYSRAITEDKINAILAGKPVHIPLKDDEAQDKSTFQFINGDEREKSCFLYRSVITEYQEKLDSRSGRSTDKDGRLSRCYVINCPLFLLYQMAYPDVLNLAANRTLIEVKDPLKFNRESDNEEFKNSYCYKIVVPAAPDKTINRYMRDDLYRCFHAIAKNQIRTMKCYLLKTNHNISKSFANGEASQTEIDTNYLRKFIHNKPVSALVDVLNWLFDEPVINATGLPKNISIDFPYDIYNYNLKKWKEFLSKRGFDIIESSRKLRVAVITDK